MTVNNQRQLWKRNDAAMPGYAASSLGALVLVLLVMALPGLAAADPLIGDVKAALATPEGAAENPAMAAMVPASALQITPVIYESNRLAARYPGADEYSRSKAGIGSAQSFVPIGVYKAGNFALGIAQILPPITTQITVDEAPVVVFNQPNLVTLHLTARVRGGLAAMAAYRLSRGFSLGIKVSYQSIGVDASIVPTGSSSELATAVVDMTTASVVVGMYMEVVENRFGLGLAAEVLKSSSMSTTVTSPLLDQSNSGGGDSAKKGDSQSSSSMPMASLLAGGYLNTGRGKFYMDVIYTRAPQDQKEFSLAELKEKTKELYDTVTFRAGGKIRINPRASALLGGRYDTSSVGQGGRGQDSAGGFSSIDLIQVYAGQSSLRPFYALAAGAEFQMGQRRRRSAAVAGGRKGSKGKGSEKAGKVGTVDTGGDTYERPPERPLTVAIGLGYQAASLGIDEKGEQPGAFTQTRIFIPMNVTYYF